MTKLKTILLALGLSAMMTASIFAQGTAFTYQGQLQSGTNAANGTYRFTFSLYAASTGGSVLGTPVTNNNVGVSNGLFSVFVDFGSNAFTGMSNWLQIAVTTNGSSTFTNLSPRQQITAAPYAVYAETANATNLVGTISGNGSGLTNLNATNLTGSVAAANLPANVALLGADQTFTGNNNFNSNVGIGTASPMGTLELRNAGGRNLVMSGPGGAEFSLYDSTAGAFGWDITGNLNAFAISDSGIGYPFTILRPSGNVGIGTTTPANLLDVQGSADFTGNVGIGTTTPAAHFHVSGGISETPYAAALFEVQNCGAACALPSFTEAVRLMNTEVNNVGLVGMGFLTAAPGTSPTNVPDAWIGTDDKASGNTHSFKIATQSGGVLTNRVFINGASGNVGIGTTSPILSAGYPAGWSGLHTFAPNAGINLIEGATQARLHLRNDSNMANVSQDFIIDSFANQINFRWLGAGLGNAYLPALTINTNLNNSTAANVGIGTTTPNSTLAVFGNIFMGKQRNNTTFNQIGDTIYLGAEQKYLANTLGAPVNGSTDWINLMANPLSAGIMFGLSGPTTANPHTNFTPLMVIKSNGNVGIGGGAATNPATALQVNGTVTATSFAGSFSGSGTGLTNVALLNAANVFTAPQTFKISPFSYGSVTTDGTNQLGTTVNQAYGGIGTITAQPLDLFVNNGTHGMFLDLNGNFGIGTITPAGHLSVVTSNGTVNIMDGPFTPEMVMTGGGQAAGVLRLRNSLEVWPDLSATTAGSLSVRDTNGNPNISLVGSNGEITCVAINLTSDRNTKENFEPVNAREVLDKVVSLPITEWQYKQQSGSRHIGPMAQDFTAAFPLNPDDKHISVVDENGVALAAIQGLNEKLEEKDARIRELEKSMDEMKQLVAKLAAQSVKEGQ